MYSYIDQHTGRLTADTTNSYQGDVIINQSSMETYTHIHTKAAHIKELIK